MLREAIIASLAMTIGIMLVLVLRSPGEVAQQSLAQPLAPASKAKLERSTTVKLASDIAPVQLQQLLESRRSIMPKDYTGNLLPESTIRGILEAAPWAPSHGKTEPWRFVVFGGSAKQQLLDMTLNWYKSQPASFWASAFVNEKTGEPYYPDAQSFADYYATAADSKWGPASHLIAICARRQRAELGKKQHPVWEENAAVACAVQNMHLHATAAKVGAYWSSW